MYKRKGGNKMKREKKGKLEYSKGITLIALVITIIVLLILAAVSVSTLTGENGILTKATKAKEDTQKEATREKVQMAVLASYNQNGDVDITILKKELEKIGGTVTDTNEEFPVTVTVDDYTFIIDEKGKVTEGSQGGSEIEEVYTLTEEYLDFDEETGSIALKEAYSYYDWFNETFRNCELGKAKIKIPNEYNGQEVKKIGIVSSMGDTSQYQGFNISDVEEIILPEGVTEIVGTAFMNCSQLSKIKLPDTIQIIR